MDTRSLRKKIRDLVEPALAHLGYDLVAVEWLGSPHGGLLRLSIDQDGGVTAADCARASERLSPLLDEADPIEGRYDLEVSSPGIDRPLQRAADFARFAGYRARIRLAPGPERRRWTGVLRGLEADRVKLEVEGQEVVFPVEAVEEARLVLDLDEYERLAAGVPAPEMSHDDQ